MILFRNIYFKIIIGYSYNIVYFIFKYNNIYKISLTCVFLNSKGQYSICYVDDEKSAVLELKPSRDWQLGYMVLLDVRLIITQWFTIIKAGYQLYFV